MSSRLHQLQNSGRLEAWAPPLPPRENKHRILLVTKELIPWLQARSTVQESGYPLSEAAELQEAAIAFIAGKPLTDMVRVDPQRKGVSKIKTRRFRLFGWTPLQPMTYVISHGWAAADMKPPDRILRDRDAVELAANLRKSLGLEAETNFGDPRDVLRVRS